MLSEKYKKYLETWKNNKGMGRNELAGVLNERKCKKVDEKYKISWKWLEPQRMLKKSEVDKRSL